MLILSQEEQFLINIKNTISIGVKKYNIAPNEIYSIIAVLTTGEETTLGYYSYEQRAKEILQEIMTSNAVNKTFYMPKE